MYAWRRFHLIIFAILHWSSSKSSRQAHTNKVRMNDTFCPISCLNDPSPQWPYSASDTVSPPHPITSTLPIMRSFIRPIYHSRRPSLLRLMSSEGESDLDFGPAQRLRGFEAPTGIKEDTALMMTHHFACSPDSHPLPPLPSFPLSSMGGVHPLSTSSQCHQFRSRLP